MATFSDVQIKTVTNTDGSTYLRTLTYGTVEVYLHLPRRRFRIYLPSALTADDAAMLAMMIEDQLRWLKEQTDAAPE